MRRDAGRRSRPPGRGGRAATVIQVARAPPPCPRRAAGLCADSQSQRCRGGRTATMSRLGPRTRKLAAGARVVLQFRRRQPSWLHACAGVGSSASRAPAAAVLAAAARQPIPIRPGPQMPYTLATFLTAHARYKVPGDGCDLAFLRDLVIKSRFPALETQEIAGERKAPVLATPGAIWAPLAAAAASTAPRGSLPGSSWLHFQMSAAQLVTRPVHVCCAVLLRRPARSNAP